MAVGIWPGIAEAQVLIRVGASLSQKTIAEGALDLATKRGLQTVLAESNPRGTTDFGPILKTVKAVSPDVTAFGPFKVGTDGFQVAHKVVIFQWQDGKTVIVWPDEIAPVQPRFPTPPWRQR